MSHRAFPGAEIQGLPGHPVWQVQTLLHRQVSKGCWPRPLAVPSAALCHAKLLASCRRLRQLDALRPPPHLEVVEEREEQDSAKHGGAHEQDHTLQHAVGHHFRDRRGAAVLDCPAAAAAAVRVCSAAVAGGRGCAAAGCLLLPLAELLLIRRLLRLCTGRRREGRCGMRSCGRCGRLHGRVESECATRHSACQCKQAAGSMSSVAPLAQHCYPPFGFTCSCSTVSLGDGREATLPRLLFCSRSHRMGAEIAPRRRRALHPCCRALHQASQGRRAARRHEVASGSTESKPALGHSSAPAG